MPQYLKALEGIGAGRIGSEVNARECSLSQAEATHEVLAPRGPTACRARASGWLHKATPFFKGLLSALLHWRVLHLPVPRRGEPALKLLPFGTPRWGNPWILLRTRFS